LNVAARPTSLGVEEGTIAAMVLAGCSSISQWPEFAMTAPITSLATKRSSSRHPGAVGFFGADRQHRHGQLTVGEERPVIDAVLRECDELLEASCIACGWA
jgi:hypothetical protein